MLTQMVVIWIVVAALAVVAILRPPQDESLQLFGVGAAGVGMVVAGGWLLVMLAQYPGARAGLVIALAIAAVVGAIMYPLAHGWRPGLPRLSMPRLPRLPVRAVWPQGRYRTQYAAEIWTVENFEK